MNKVLSDERLGAKLRVTENQCVVLFFNLCILSSSTTALSTLCHFMSTLFFDLCMYGYLTNREALAVLCSVIKHAGSG